MRILGVNAINISSNSLSCLRSLIRVSSVLSNAVHAMNDRAVDLRVSQHLRDPDLGRVVLLYL